MRLPFPPATVVAVGLTVVAVLAGCSQPRPVGVPTPSATVSGTPSARPTPTTTPSATPTATPTAAPGATPTAGASPAARDPRYLANLTPYAAPKLAKTVPPAGYQVAFTENISRHGSRSLTSGADSERALKLWDRAAQADALTGRGAGFGPAVRTLTTGMRSLGYGQLSARGRAEQLGLGQREGDRVHDYFERVEDAGDTVKIIDSDVDRTDDSGKSFAAGLQKAHPSLSIDDSGSDSRTLKFSETDPAYKKFLDDGKQWKAAYRKAVQAVDLSGASVIGLRRLYTPDFVATLSDPVAEARAVWDLYRVDEAMSSDVDVNLTSFMEPKTAAAFAFAEDAEYFYARGPGLTGTSDARRAANVLLRDFVAKANDRLSGGSVAGVYRFSHDQEVAPFAARLGLPTNRQLASANQVFSWSISNYDTARIVPLAANINWTLWRNAAGSVLLQVRQNEVPTTLAPSCRPARQAPGFYAWTEVKRCLVVG